jgi:hypothetical protein
MPTTETHSGRRDRPTLENPRDANLRIRREEVTVSRRVTAVETGVGSGYASNTRWIVQWETPIALVCVISVGSLRTHRHEGMGA